MPKLFDIHCHLNFEDFKQDRDDVIRRTLAAGIWMINVGSDYENSKKAVEIAEKYDEGVYASVGLHPYDSENEVFDINKYRDLAENEKVVAIGECGIDLKSQPRHGGTNLKSQIELFKQQLELALEIDKPLMIHCRDAHDDLIKILTTYYSIHNTKLRGNIHFFSGTFEQVQKYFALGFTISFTGVLTYDIGGTDIVSRFRNEIIKKAPLDKIMVETDAPFVAPLPWRGQRNEPLYVQETTKRMAELRGMPYEEIAKITTKNAWKLFNPFPQKHR